LLPRGECGSFCSPWTTFVQSRARRLYDGPGPSSLWPGNGLWRRSSSRVESSRFPEKEQAMHGVSRRTFLKTASTSAVLAAASRHLPNLMANPLGLPIGLQLYSVRDILPKDYEGTLRQLAGL